MGVVWLPRPVLWDPARQQHLLPGNAWLPEHGGMLITRRLQEWACLLGIDFSFPIAQRLLGWQAGEEKLLCPKEVQRLVCRHGQVLQAAAAAEVQELLARPDREGLAAPWVPATPPRQPILRLQNGRDRCVELAAQAVLEHERGDTPSAVAYDANGEESRWLLDRKNAARFEKALFDKAARVAQPPDHQSFDSVARAAMGGDVRTGFQGYLANELRNITFTGEREAAADTVKRFGDYFRIDGRIRSLENSGRHAQAVELCIGSRKGESNYAFDQFDKRLGDVIDINQKEFDRAAAHGMNALNSFGLIAAVVSLAAAALIGLGLRPRLKEYSF